MALRLGRTITHASELKRGRVYTQRQPDGRVHVSVVAARDGFDLLGNEQVAYLEPRD